MDHNQNGCNSSKIQWYELLEVYFKSKFSDRDLIVAQYELESHHPPITNKELCDVIRWAAENSEIKKTYGVALAQVLDWRLEMIHGKPGSPLYGVSYK